jgi:hypothetical protein
VPRFRTLVGGADASPGSAGGGSGPRLGSGGVALFATPATLTPATAEPAPERRSRPLRPARTPPRARTPADPRPAHRLPFSLRMRNVRLHPGDPIAPVGGPGHPAPTGEAHRFNLLLSYAGWDETPWVDRLPPLLRPMGVHAHRAADARQASRVIESTPIHVAVVDLALPLEQADGPAANPSRNQEAGPRVLDLLARLASPVPTLVIKRGRTSREDHREMAAALRAGAFAVLDRPRQHRDVETLLELLRRVLQRHYANQWPGADRCPDPPAS